MRQFTTKQGTDKMKLTANQLHDLMWTADVPDDTRQETTRCRELNVLRNKGLVNRSNPRLNGQSTWTITDAGLMQIGDSTECAAKGCIGNHTSDHRRVV